jgi:hypothetical protein
MGIDSEVKVLSEADHSNRSEPQSVDREAGVKEAGSEAAGRRTGTGFEAEPSRASGQRTAKLP